MQMKEENVLFYGVFDALTCKNQYKCKRVCHDVSYIVVVIVRNDEKQIRHRNAKIIIIIVTMNETLDTFSYH